MVGKRAPFLRSKYRTVIAMAGVVAGVAGCLGPFPSHPEPAAHPALRPEGFFSGRTQGKGTLRLITGRERSIEVEGRGHIEPDGRLRLEQVVTFDDGKVEKRTWRLHRTGPGVYAAELSDASGPVSVEAAGNVMHLRYRVRHPGVYMRQSLYLAPDGRTVSNRATITMLGVPIARLTEEIVKLTP